MKEKEKDKLKDKANEDDFLCPLCGKPMTARPDATGVTMICLGACIPTCYESVFGHGSNKREAWEIACEKYRH